MSDLLYRVAESWIGTRELAGSVDNPDIMRMLSLDNEWPEHDEVPWCSAAMNLWAFAIQAKRSRSLMARSWLEVGLDLPLQFATRGDVVILSRGGGAQPDASVLDAPGHVALFSRLTENTVEILGGNQGDQVSIAGYDRARVLGVRRITEE